MVAARSDGFDVTCTEFRSLCELARARPGVHPRGAPRVGVWGYEYVGDTKLVGVHSHRLRSRIEANPSDP